MLIDMMKSGVRIDKFWLDKIYLEGHLEYEADNSDAKLGIGVKYLAVELGIGIEYLEVELCIGIGYLEVDLSIGIRYLEVELGIEIGYLEVKLGIGIGYLEVELGTRVGRKYILKNWQRRRRENVPKLEFLL
ncbi:hypothetical protein FXO37_08592 [Capsicum annuum]|nr:hypothetical protein FXO37_08592 [Capsicum annuum]